MLGVGWGRGHCTAKGQYGLSFTLVTNKLFIFLYFQEAKKFTVKYFPTALF